MNKQWQELYYSATKVLRPRQISSTVEAGGVAAAVESTGGNIYLGVCVDTACSLGLCAERNAIFNMLTNGEDAIKRIIAINSKGKPIPPCGACRDLMAQLQPNDYKSIEIMIDEDKVATLGDLTPEWWTDNFC